MAKEKARGEVNAIRLVKILNALKKNKSLALADVKFDLVEFLAEYDVEATPGRSPTNNRMRDAIFEEQKKYPEGINKTIETLKAKGALPDPLAQKLLKIAAASAAPGTGGRRTTRNTRRTTRNTRRKTKSRTRKHK